MLDIFKKTLFASVGAVMMTEEKIRETINELVKKGEVSEKEGEGLVRELLQKVENTRTGLEDRVKLQIEKALNSFNVAHKKDILALKRKVKKLEDELESLRRAKP